MFTELPDAVQQQVRTQLRTNNFQAAKAIYDHWLQKQNKRLFDSVAAACEAELIKSEGLPV